LTCAGVRVSRLPESPSLLRAPPLSSRRPAQSADMLCNTALLDLHALRRLYAGRVSIHLYVCVCERECVCDFYDALRGLHHSPCHCHYVPADRRKSSRYASIQLPVSRASIGKNFSKLYVAGFTYQIY